MIRIPSGWRHLHGVHLVTLYPEGGGGRFRYYERLPVARASALVARILADDPAFRATATGGCVPFLTQEGEHGILVPMRGVREGARAWRSLAMVYTDEFAAALDALIVAPERREALELRAYELMVTLSFGLGVRRRRFFYRPPPGWWAMPSGLTATWHPPGYPREATSLVVAAATPRPGFEWATSEFGEGVELRDDGFAERGFSARRFVRDEGDLHHETVVLHRRPYVHTLELSTREASRHDELRGILDAVATSVEPVPDAAPRSFRPGAATAMGHWVC